MPPPGDTRHCLQGYREQIMPALRQSSPVTIELLDKSDMIARFRLRRSALNTYLQRQALRTWRSTPPWSTLPSSSLHSSPGTTRSLSSALTFTASEIWQSGSPLPCRSCHAPRRLAVAASAGQSWRNTALRCSARSCAKCAHRFGRVVWMPRMKWPSRSIGDMDSHPYSARKPLILHMMAIQQMFL